MKAAAPLVVTFDIAEAACRDEDPDLFFPDPPDPEDDPFDIAERAFKVAAAKQVCGGCPLRDECREWSLTVRELYGVWGGLDETERQTIIRRRDRKPRCVHRGCGRAQTADGLCPGHHPTVEDRYANRYRKVPA